MKAALQVETLAELGAALRSSPRALLPNEWGPTTLAGLEFLAPGARFVTLGDAALAGLPLAESPGGGSLLEALLAEPSTSTKAGAH